MNKLEINTQSKDDYLAKHTEAIRIFSGKFYERTKPKKEQSDMDKLDVTLSACSSAFIHGLACLVADKDISYAQAIEVIDALKDTLNRCVREMQKYE